MCFEIAWREISNGSAISFTVAGPRLRRAMIARRTGSARAAKPRSTEVLSSVMALFNHTIDQPSS